MATILITGSTDGIGLGAAVQLAAQGHTIAVHGRDEAKLAAAQEVVLRASPTATVTGHLGDLSVLADTARLADEVAAAHPDLGTVINNAGVLRARHERTVDGLDVRFAVNTVSPYLLTTHVMSRLSGLQRIANISSAAQSPVNLPELTGERPVPDMQAAYAESKLALIMWTNQLAANRVADGPALFSINPGSLLATKMVREGYGMTGRDANIGIDILVRAATASEFADANGLYYDNDNQRFARPHPEAQDPAANATVTATLDSIIASRLGETSRT